MWQNLAIQGAENNCQSEQQLDLCVVTPKITQVLEMTEILIH